jgi:flagellar L-ring protein precursor FlgH
VRKVCLGGVLLLAACASNGKGTDPDQGRTRPAQSASLWNQDPESMFGNRRAREVGDVLTVLVAIDDEAQILNNNDRNRISEREFELPSYYGLPQWAERNLLPEGGLMDSAVEVNQRQRVRGQGRVQRQDRITLRLAARIVGTEPNGDLRIEGRQMVQVGGDQRHLSVRGIVRPEDISRGNTIQHDRIAEANIRYTGRGPLSATSRKGWGNKLLDMALPF